MNGLSKMVTLLIVLGIAFVGFFFFVGIAHIEGHQLAIRETFVGGVDKTGGEMKDGIFHPRRHFYVRGLTEYALYDMRVHHFVLNDKTEKDGESGEGRAADALWVQFAGGQKGKLSLDLRWRYNQSHLLTTHGTVRNDINMMHEKVIRNALQRIVIDKCTVLTALEAYYGETRVKLEKDIDESLKNLPEFTDKGIIVDGFVMQIALDPKYEEEIAQKVTAGQRQARMEAEKLANDKQADAERSKAQIEANQKIVAAEAAKQVGILQKEQEAQQTILTAEAANKAAILAAQAEKQKRVLEASGESEANELKAKGNLAIATAEAKGEELKKLAKYDGTSGEIRARVEIAVAQAEKLKGIFDGAKILPNQAFVSVMDSAEAAGGVKPVLQINK